MPHEMNLLCAASQTQAPRTTWRKIALTRCGEAQEIRRRRMVLIGPEKVRLDPIPQGLNRPELGHSDPASRNAPNCPGIDPVLPQPSVSELKASVGLSRFGLFWATKAPPSAWADRGQLTHFTPIVKMPGLLLRTDFCSAEPISIVRLTCPCPTPDARSDSRPPLDGVARSPGT